MAKEQDRTELSDGHRQPGPSKAKRLLKGLGFGALVAALITPKGRHYLKMILTAFLEMLRRSPSIKSEPQLQDGFLVIGHRGAPSRMVENTIESFEAAIEEDGANAIELDLCMTKDRQIVVWHDWDPDEARAIARGLALETGVAYCPYTPPLGHELRKPLHELTVDEWQKHFGQRVKELVGVNKMDCHKPTFDEFMQWAVTKRQLKYVFLDMKLPDDLPELAEEYIKLTETIVRKHNPNFKWVYLTPYVDILKIFKRVNPGTNYILDNDPPPGFIIEPCKFTSVTGAIRFGNAYADTVHPKAVTFAPWTTFRRIMRCDVRLRNRHNAHGPKVRIEKVVATSINEDYKTELLLKLGVDGLMSDRPALIREIALKMGKTLA